MAQEKPIKHPLHEIVPPQLVAVAILAELRFANDQRMRQVDIHQQKPLQKELDALRSTYERPPQDHGYEAQATQGRELKQHADRHPGKPETAQELGERLEREALAREAQERAAQEANRDKRLDPPASQPQKPAPDNAQGQQPARMTVSEARALAEKVAAAARQGSQEPGKQGSDVQEPVNTGPTVQFGAPADTPQQPGDAQTKLEGDKTRDTLKANVDKSGTPKK